MIVVKIELWPRGDPNQAREIGRAEIVNDGTGTREKGNYQVRLRHSGRYTGRPGFWKRGAVSGVSRLLSPYHLVMLALGATLLDKE